MASVTKRIAAVKQPRGGYINPKNLTVKEYNDGVILNETENIHPSIVGMVVDYLTRYYISRNLTEAFHISISGAKCVGKLEEAFDMLAYIEEGKDVVKNACRLASYDEYFRTGNTIYRPVEYINPSKETEGNIIAMVQRGMNFLNMNGPIVKSEFTFEGGYTDVINSGDGDYITKNGLWDFKVSKNTPTNKQTLQILIYYIMGIHSVYSYFENIKTIGLYNPRLNVSYSIDVKDIPKETIKMVEKDVICYPY